MGRLSPHEVFFSRPPELQVRHFFQPGMMRVARDAKSNVQSVPRHFLNNGYNNPSSTVKVIKASTGSVCYTSNVVWMVSCASMPPAPAVGGGAVGHSVPVSTTAPGFTFTYRSPPSLTQPIKPSPPPIQPSPPWIQPSPPLIQPSPPPIQPLPTSTQL